MLVTGRDLCDPDADEDERGAGDLDGRELLVAHTSA
jgi:hypothetical protein